MGSLMCLDDRLRSLKQRLRTGARGKQPPVRDVERVNELVATVAQRNDVLRVGSANELHVSTQDSRRSARAVRALCRGCAAHSRRVTTPVVKPRAARTRLSARAVEVLHQNCSHILPPCLASEITAAQQPCLRRLLLLHLHASQQQATRRPDGEPPADEVGFLHGDGKHRGDGVIVDGVDVDDLDHESTTRRQRHNTPRLFILVSLKMSTEVPTGLQSAML